MFSISSGAEHRPAETASVDPTEARYARLRLLAAGFGEWNDLAKLDEVRDLLAGSLGADRVLVGFEGFHEVACRRPIPARPGG